MHVACDPPLTVLQYIMYFWFCGGRHVFIPWSKCTRIQHGVILEEVRQVALPVGHEYKQCLVKFIRMWHRWQSLLSMIALMHY